jgi:molybdopterin/thiamine biosynthesis adenylyltransferase
MLSDENLERYARQVIMPELGEDGQQALLDARVLVVGAGGLGAPALFYLAAAGIGHITILDNEQVELTNLNRQIVHTTASIGSNKVAQAAAAIGALNPEISINPVMTWLDAENVAGFMLDHDVILDCSDNVKTRYLLGDAAHVYARPLVFGGAVRTEGQLAVFQSGSAEMKDSPCYRCVFPEMPDAKQAPGCSEAGILGPVTGIIGALQALEAIKLITGIGSSLTGKLMLFDGRGGGFMEISISARDDCTTCGNASG